MNENDPVPLADIRIVESCEKLRKERIPVTIVTGFLGSGKTTLINHLLTARHGQKIAVIENEFGEVSVDDQLLVGRQRVEDEDRVVLMPNGCMCCRVRGDLVKALKSLVIPFVEGRGEKLDSIVIETSGLSEVAPIAQTFFADQYVQRNLQLDCVVTVCDAKVMHAQLTAQHEVKRQRVEGSEKQLLLEQLLLADRVLVNKMDTLSEDERPALEDAVRQVNPTAMLLWCSYGKIDVKEITGTSAFNFSSALDVSSFGDLMAGKRSTRAHVHDSFRSIALEESEREIDLAKLQQLIAKLLKDFPDQVVRYKGILWAKNERHRVIMQGVYSNVDWVQGEPWKFGQPKTSKVVIIGRDLGEHAEDIKSQFRQCRVPQPTLFGPIIRMGPQL